MIVRNCLTTVGVIGGRGLVLTLGLGVALYATACEGPFTGMNAGTVDVTVTTTGADPDSDGYTVALDSGTSRPVSVNGTLSFTDVTPGTHVISVGDVAANCAVPGNPRTVTVPAGGNMEVGVAVTCASNTGSLAVWVETSGVDLDPDGYMLVVDGVAIHALPTNGGVTVGNVSLGHHTLTLAGLASNCTPAIPSVGVDVGFGSYVQLTLVVSCHTTTGNLTVNATTTGADLDSDGYTVTNDGTPVGTVTSNGTVTLGPFQAESMVVALTGIAANCTVAPSSQKVLITAGTTATAAFTVTCVASPRLRVITSTSGTELDPNGYVLSFVDSTSSSIVLRTNGDTVVVGLKAGGLTLVLSDVEGNCQVSGGNSQTVTLVAAETTKVTFQITCVAPHREIAFNDEASGGISSMTSTGSNILHLVYAGWYPAWSPDGTRIAFIANTCGPVGCHTDVYEMAADGTGVSQVLISGAGTSPNFVAWKPDGTGFAFSGMYNGTYGLYVMNADGSNVAPVITGDYSRPSWSPDGMKLAFNCTIDTGNSDICVVNADGTGFVRLTTDVGTDQNPVWKPDGSKILFTRISSSFNGLVTMNPDGTAAVGMLSGWLAYTPTWAPDGTRIAFYTPGGCDASYSWSYCNPDQIIVVNADGTNPISINSAGNTPAWGK